MYVNEEVKHRRENPGKAAIYAVAILTVPCTLAQAGLQGVVSPARLPANASTAMAYLATALGDTGRARLIALAIALSVIAATGTAIVLTSRIIYGMASYRTLPLLPGQVSPRFKTPAAASVAVGALITAATWAYILATSAQAILGEVVSLAGLLAAASCILTALATIACYRRRVFSNVLDPVILGGLSAGRRRVPRLDHRQVATERAGVTAAVAGRHRRGRHHRHGLRPVRPAVRVLPDPAGKRLEGAVMNAPARPVPAGQHDVITCLVCGMTGPSPDSPCRPGRDHRVSPPEAGCPGCGRLTAVCARRFPCQARRSKFRWQLMRLRLRRAWRRLRPRPGPPCCGTPGRCSR